MTKNVHTREKLVALVDVLSSTAAKSVELIFSSAARIETPWHVVEHLDCKCQQLITMGSANINYSTLTIVGMTNSAIECIIGEQGFDQEFLLDILGELVNTYCALLDDCEKYSEAFGKQIQTVPVLYSEGAPFIPFLHGVQGEVQLGDNSIYVGFVIRRNGMGGEE